MSTYENQTGNEGTKMLFKDAYGETIVAGDMSDPQSYDRTFQLLRVAREADTLPEGRFLQYCRMLERRGYKLPEEVANNPFFHKARFDGRRLKMAHVIAENESKNEKGRATVREYVTKAKLTRAITMLDNQMSALEKIARNLPKAA